MESTPRKSCDCCCCARGDVLCAASPASLAAAVSAPCATLPMTVLVLLSRREARLSVNECCGRAARFASFTCCRTDANQKQQQ